MLKQIRNYIILPERLLFRFVSCFNFLFPDKRYLEIIYYLKMGKKLNLNNPRTFTEKLQWLKLYNHRPEYTSMVNKYTVKDVVSEVIGKEHIIPTIGVWDRPEQIDWDKLPNQFVLKTTHGGGGSGVVICKDKSSFDKKSAIKKLNKSLKTDLYKINREWPYRNVSKQVIAEEYLSGDNGILNDYKLFCFNGIVKIFKIDLDRFSKHRANYYDKEGNLMPFGEVACPPDYIRNVRLPEKLSTMISMAEKISSTHHFMRIDFYQNAQKVYFGEITFFPAAGFGKFTDEKWDLELGSWLLLPSEKTS